MQKKEKFDNQRIQQSDLRPPEKITRKQGSREIFNLILDSIYIGVVVTDPNGYIMYLNKPYGEFLGINPEEQIGKHVTDVIENTRMHIVAETGKAEVNHKQHINNTDMVVQRIPIKKTTGSSRSTAR